MTVNANAPSQGTRLCAELLLWFGPALLFGGLLAWWMRSGGASAPGGLGGTGMAKSTARRLRPLLGQAHTTFADVAGIGRARGGSASAGGHNERERPLNQRSGPGLRSYASS